VRSGGTSQTVSSATRSNSRDETTKRTLGALANHAPTVSFATLGVTFAWDRVCVFGPYTDRAKAASVLQLDWNIEERSQIAMSDSVNALVFLYQGKVNQVVDLKRGIADFKALDRCFAREHTTFRVEVDADGRKILVPEG
jgi:hypothetical protein